MDKKDKKGRKLNQGERQRKDGRYEYRYKDSLGKTKSVYSWRLKDTDATPEGKPRERALREMEVQIAKDKMEGIAQTDITLNAYFDIFLEAKQELRESSWVNIKVNYTRYFRESIGCHPLTSINYTMVKKHYLSIIDEHALTINSMRVVNNVLHQLFESAIKDGLVRNNPTNGILKELRKKIPSSSSHVPLTREEQTVFLGFVKGSPRYRRWYPLFLFLLSTGCRIGEAAGLRWEDCDFEKNEIHIERTLYYGRRKAGSYGVVVNSPKTKTSQRTIPMMSVLKTVLLQEQGRVYYKQNGELLDIKDPGLVFHNMRGTSLSSNSVDAVIHHICAAYNRQETAVALDEGREPILLPDFTAHALRHTFCTRYSENESNLRVIMEIMGHSDITTTMNIYSRATSTVKKTSMQELEEKVFVG